ncbi:MAG: hypothetical protein E7080_10645 [Bacteroidales bacterium]|nr:hypothetical protein [Bacteroidales bacterium]
MNILENARKLRKIIEQASESLTDAVASEAPELFASLKHDGSLVKVGTRINWNGVVKRAAVDLWDTEANNPSNTPTLWEDIAYKQGYRIIPETITAGTAFSNGEMGWWGDTLYKSVIDSNVWTPMAHASGWEVVEM